MKWLLALIFILGPMTGTVANKRVQFDQAIEHSLLCGVTAYGVSVRAHDVKCPDLKAVGEQERRFLSRMSAGPLALWGTVAVFTGTDADLYAESLHIRGINPNKHYVVTYSNGKVWETYSHELGHLLIRRARMATEQLHYANDACPDMDEEHDDWEACELLDAAESWYTSIPMLDPSSRFRKAFEKL